MKVPKTAEGVFFLAEDFGAGCDARRHQVVTVDEDEPPEAAIGEMAALDALPDRLVTHPQEGGGFRNAKEAQRVSVIGCVLAFHPPCHFIT